MDEINLNNTSIINCQISGINLKFTFIEKINHAKIILRANKGKIVLIIEISKKKKCNSNNLITSNCSNGEII
jgi:hypothetical protein